METTRCALIFLISACLWGTSCTSIIKLCKNSPTSFENGTTIPAMLGKPVSVVFCVQCQQCQRIIKYIKINHTNHPTEPGYFYTNNKDVWRPIIVNITSSEKKATINIFIKTVQTEDFIGQFSVDIHTDKGVSNNSVFVFHLSDAAISVTDSNPSDAFLILSTQPTMPAVTSIRTSPASSFTELSTVSSQARTASTSTDSPTHKITQCKPHKTSQCPTNWYKVDNETCLLVTRVSHNETPSDVCNGHGSEPVKDNNIKQLSSCLIRILGEMKVAFNKYVVRVDSTTFVNVNRGTDVTDRGTYSVICNNRTLNFSPSDVPTTRRNRRPLAPAKRSTSVIPQTSQLSTLSTQAPTVFSSPFTSTQMMPQCLPAQIPTCPREWYQVDNDTCLIVINASLYTYSTDPSVICDLHHENLVLYANISKFTECLKYILRQSMPEPINYDVRLGANEYVNVLYGSKISPPRHNKYSVACFQKKENFKPPTVSLFALNMVNKPVRSLVDNVTNYVIENTAYAHIYLTCRAEGMPIPRVIVTDESGNDVSRNQWIRLDVCSRPGVYTCTANNSLGTSHTHRRIRLLNPLKVNQFTLNNHWDAVIESGNSLELRCSVDGCPDRVTITRNEHLIAETTNYTLPLVHEIKPAKCSHMGIYTCLAKSPTGKDVQKTASLEVKDCPVSPCKSDDASREMSPILGENVTFCLCLISSGGMKYSANDTKIVVNFTRNPITRIYWTANITMYNIQVKDYRTHTVRLTNRDGSLDIDFTLKDEGSGHTPVGQKAEGHESESSALLIALPPVCFIFLVLIIVGIVWYRVKGTRISRTRSKEIIDCGSGNDGSGEAMYANMTSVTRVSDGQEAEDQQEADTLQCQEDSNTTDLHDQESGRYISADGLVYTTVVSANKLNKKTSKGGKHTSKQKCEDEGRVEYITLDFEKTGKLLVADEEENKDDDSGEKTDTRQ